MARFFARFVFDRCTQVVLLAFCSCAFLTPSLKAQTDPNAGIQMWSTNEFGIDLATSTINLQVPLRSKAGPIPFSSYLVGTSAAFEWTQPVSNNKYMEVQSISSLPLTGYADNRALGITATESTGSCDSTPLYQSFAIVDSTGASHPLPTSYSWNTECPPVPNPAVATDGSGYTFVPLTTGGIATFAIYDSSGNEFAGQCNYGAGCALKGSLSDPDGNSLSIQDGNVLDSLSTTPVMTLGTAPSPSYTTYTGSSVGISYGYTTANGKLNFACPGWSDGSGGGATFLTSLTMFDGGQYKFAYEPTPNGNGFTNNGTYYTGRIAKITFPDGGSISYKYLGENGGFNCTSQTVPTIQVTVNDHNGGGGTWTYVNNLSSVVKTDPVGNQTVYYLSGEIRTQVLAYQGGCPTSITGCSGSGTLLQTTTTCYNAKFSNCTPGNNFPTLPITQTDVYTSYGTGSSNLVETKLDPNYGNVLEVKRYDFGATTPPTGSPISDTLLGYGQTLSPNGTSCTTYPSGIYIYNTPCFIYTENSSGTVVADALISYNNTGHPKTTKKWITGSLWLTSSATYNGNGTIATSTDVNNQLTNYYYNGTGGCNGLLLTSTMLPVNSLTTSQQWNCSGAVLTQTSDANGQPTQYGYVNEPSKGSVADPLWRRLSVTDPENYITWTDYSPGGTLPATVETYLNFTSPYSSPTPCCTVDTLNTLDGLGRVIESQRRTGPGATTFDQAVSTLYGWQSPGGVCTQSASGSTIGPCTTQTVPGGTAITTTNYDALGRTTSVTDGGGGIASYAYTNAGANNDKYSDVLVTLSPAPSGENLKKRQLEYDGLGRLSSVCEITAGTTSWPGGSCLQGTTQTGYWTTYAYDALSNLLGITQNAQGSAQQTRSYVYDGLSRLTSEKNPEWGPGTATYAYDSDTSGTCAGPYNGDLVNRTDNAGNVTCSAYDAIHRKTALTYPKGPNAAATPNKCFVYDKVVDGKTVTNVLGELGEGYTTTSACSSTQLPTVITDEAFSYSARGELADYYQSSPNSGGYYSIPITYFANGLIQSFGSFLTEDQLGYMPDGEGRAYGVYDYTYQTDYVPSITYYPSGMLNTTQTSCAGSTCYPITYTYDSNTQRMTGYSAALNGGTISGSLTWNANGSLNQFVVADPFNSDDAQTCTYGADDLSRIASVSCGSTWAQTFSYDPFGNITKNGSVSWVPGYTTSTNQYASGSGATYDADGNLTYDGTFNRYTWDAEGKVLTAGNGGSQTLGFVYDAFGQQVEYSGGGTYTASNVKLGGFKLSAIGQNPYYSEYPLPGGSMASEYGGFTAVQLGDWLGTSRAAWSYTGGTFIQSGAHAPFGEGYSYNAGAVRDFTGQQTIDGRTYNFPERQYQSWQGRWISPDPSGMSAVDPTNPQTWNRYDYVANNPLVMTDPLGLGDRMGNCPSVGQSDPVSGGCNWGNDPTLGCTFNGASMPCNMVAGLLGNSYSSGICPPSGCQNLGVNPATGEWQQVVESETERLSTGQVFVRQVWGNLPFSISDANNGGCIIANCGGPAANNGPSNVSCNSTTGICVPATMMKPRPAGCGAAIAQGAISLGLDVVGAIPAFGNVVSATAAGARAVNGIVAYGGAAYGIATGLPDESPVGAAGAGAGLGLTLADAALEGGKVIPVLGNGLSVIIGGYDAYQLAKTLYRCR